MTTAPARIVVQKFGGSSLSDMDRLNRAARCAAAAHLAGNRTVVVVSARGDTTDELLELAGEVGGQSTGDLTREIDQLLATGEAASAALMAMAVNALGVPAVSLTGPQAGIRVNGRYGAGVIAEIVTDRIQRLLAEGNLVVIGGFQGANDAGDVVTLGRGGSDTTAAALAVALDAGLCEIYTDVDGVHTADPRIVTGTKRLTAVDPGAMAEMAFSGAKVLHSRAVELCAVRGMELRVRDVRAEGMGTLVTRGTGAAALETANAVVAITHDFDVARLLLRARHDLAVDVLAGLARYSVPVDLVARSGAQEDEFRMGFTVRRSELAGVETVLRHVLAGIDAGKQAQLRIDEQVAKISLIGMGLLNRPEYAARMMSALAAAGIVTNWIWTSQLRVSVVVPLGSGAEAVNVLHREFDLGTPGSPTAVLPYGGLDSRATA